MTGAEPIIAAEAAPAVAGAAKGGAEAAGGAAGAESLIGGAEGGLNIGGMLGKGGEGAAGTEALASAGGDLLSPVGLDAEASLATGVPEGINFTSPLTAEAGGGATLPTGVAEAAPTGGLGGTEAAGGTGITEGVSGTSGVAQVAKDPATKGVLESLGIKNPAGAAIGAAGLGYSVLQGQRNLPSTDRLQAEADSLGTQGKQLMSYLSSGKLPPGLQAALERATKSAKAQAISNAAGQGLNTDPTKNTPLAQQLAMIDQQAIIEASKIGESLFKTGLSASGISADLLRTISSIDQRQTENMGRAIANFAAALSGGQQRRII